VVQCGRWEELGLLLAAQGATLPEYVQREFDDYLKCGRLEYGFLRLRCDTCHAERLVAFSCKRRGFCPSCGARRMAESAALLVDEVLPHEPMRQWVLSFPFQLRFLFASRPAIMGQVLGIIYRVIATHLTKKSGFTKKTAQTGAVTLIQRFGSALNLNIHFHMLFLDGVYIDAVNGLPPRFRWVKAPTSDELTQLAHSLARRIGRFLERQGLLERDTEQDYLTSDAVAAGPMDQLLGIPLPTASPWGRNKAARCLPCKPCQRAIQMNRSQTRWARWLGSRSMPAWPLKPTHGTNSNACAATSPGRRYRKNGCHGHPRARCATGSRHRIETVRPMSSSSRWISSHGWPRWCPSRAST
jgi:hypothetical protein